MPRAFGRRRDVRHRATTVESPNAALRVRRGRSARRKRMLRDMRALLFGADPEPVATPLPADAGVLERNLRGTPMAVQELADPRPLGTDWVVMRTRLCGIC